MPEQVVKHNVLQQFVQRASSLYSLPAVAVEVLELTGRADVDTAALRECVERDPALTAKLLRVVNSSMFGLSREVSDLAQALTLLGVKPLKLLVLGFSLPKELYAGAEAETLQRFWQFTLVKAVAARELAKAFWRSTGDEAFIAGLLQEIGVLVLINELGDSYVNFLDSVHEQGADLVALEAETLGFDHTILSARLLDHWNLPTAIVQAVAVPHDVQQIAALAGKDAELPQMLHLATLIASIIVEGRHQLMAELLTAGAQYRGITVQQIEHLLDKLQEQVSLMASMFSVRVDQQQSFRDIMTRAHQQMSQAALDALPDMVSTGACAISPQRDALHAALDTYAQNFLDLSHSAAPAQLRGQRSPAVAVSAVPATRSTPTARLENTGDPGLIGRLQRAIVACRNRQCELSLMLLEIDDFDQLLLTQGPDRATRLIAAVKQAVGQLADIPCESVLVSDSRSAVILPDCDRQQAVTLARSLLDAIPLWIHERGWTAVMISCTASVATLATLTRGSRAEELVDAADRCLFAAKRSGGAMVKSIDVL